MTRLSFVEAFLLSLNSTTITRIMERMSSPPAMYSFLYSQMWLLYR